jgi:hypothetical protein
MSLQSIHQFTPSRIAQRAEFTDGFEPAVGEPEHCRATFTGNGPGEGGTHPFSMIAVATPNYTLTRLELLNLHPKDHAPPIKAKLCLAADPLGRVGVGSPPVPQASLSG